MPPAHEFTIGDRDLTVTVFPGLSVISGTADALASVRELRATAFVDSLAQTREQLAESGWTTEGSLGAGNSLLARDPDGMLAEFVEIPGVGMSHVTVAVVAGAGGALGHATTAALAASGFAVVAVDRSDHAMSDLRGAVRRETADPADPGAVTRLIDRIAAEVGPPGVLVNTVGSFRPGGALAATPESLRLMLDVNLGRSCRCTAVSARPAPGRIRITMIRR